MRFGVISFVVGLLGLLLVPGAVLAATVGTIGEVNQGQDEFGTAVSSSFTFTEGNDEESGETLEDFFGQGGNAITVFMSDELASIADKFTITATGCAGAGTQVVALNATSVVQMCNQIDVINQGCTNRMDGGIDIVAPFLCTISHWEFITGVVPARISSIQLFGVTDADAGNVDLFRMFYDSTLIESNSSTFDSVFTGLQMAAAIGSLSTLISTTYIQPPGPFVIFSNDTGPVIYSGLQLEFITPATRTSVVISNLSDAEAAGVNQFTLNLNGTPVDSSGVNFPSISTVAQLAVDLNGLPGITVSLSAPGEITIASSVLGFVTFSNIGLLVRPVLETSEGTAEFTENGDAVVVDPDVTASYGLAGNLMGATISVSPFSVGLDQLGFTPIGMIMGSFSGGTLTLSGSATVSDYQAALRSITYDSDNDDPPSAVTVNFRVHDGVDDSMVVLRVVDVTAVNDPPALTVNNTPLNYSEGNTTPVDSGLLLGDPDNTDIQTATVSITAGYNASEDQLEFVNASGISGVFAAGEMSLTGPAAIGLFETALRSVRYRNLSEAPDESQRTVAFSAHDGTDGSLVVTRQVTVTAVNDPPVVSTSPGQVEYSTRQLLTIDAGLDLNDADHLILENALVLVTSGFVAGEDRLIFTSQNVITGSYGQDTGILELMGVASLEDYITALQSVAYENTNRYPDLGLRTISFEVYDGIDWSNRASKVIRMPIFLDGLEDRQ